MKIPENKATKAAASVFSFGGLLLAVAFHVSSSQHAYAATPAAAVASTSAASSATPVMIPLHGSPSKTTEAHVEVRGARIHAKDILVLSPGNTGADVDLGVSPPVGTSRLIDRGEIERAFSSAGVAAPKKIPVAIRVTRKMRHLSAADVTSAMLTAFATKPVPRGATIASIKSSQTDVAADFDHVTVDLPSSLPRRSGPATVQAVVTFLGEGDLPIHKMIIPMELSLPQSAAFADIPKGSPITLVVRKNLIEVSVGAVAGADADIGSVMPVTLKPSGRIVRARAIDKDHAVALEDS